MDSLKHSVRKETVTVQCDSAECALELRPRLADFNASHFIPVVERVLSETAIAGSQIRIGRLEVNLGNIELSEFEAVAATRLYRALKEAVERAIRSPFHSNDRPEAVSHSELLEWYLLRGTLPFWGPPAASFSFEASFVALALRDPAELARLIRHTAKNDRALRRIVEQLDPGELRRLVAILDPEHAGLILAYMLDLGEVQREERLVRVEESAFDRLLWLLVLSYLVREAGSQFNRKMFVASLIAGFGEHEGMPYEEVLAMLGQGLQGTLMRHGLPSSLPATIAELLRDSGLAESEPSRVAEESGSNPDGAAPVNWSVAALAVSEPDALVRLVRRNASDPGWLERLVSVLDEEALIRLIGLLEPEQSAMIVAFLFDVKEVHQEEPVLAEEPGQFERVLWTLALAYLVRESGSQFNRKAFLLELVQRLAESARLDFTGVLATLQLGLEKAAARTPLKSSLPAVLAGLLEDLDRQPGGEPGDYDLVEMLRGYLENGTLPWISILRDPSQTPERALTRLPYLPVSLIETVLGHDDAGRRLELVLAAARRMPVEDVRRLLSRLLPSVDELGSPIAGALQAAIRNVADIRILYGHLIVAVLGGQPFDFEQLREDSAGAATPALREDPEQPGPQALRAAIATGLAAGSASSGGGPTGPGERPVPQLVAALIRQDAPGGRLFLRRITDRPSLRDVLIRSCSPEDFARILGLLAGPNAQGVRALLTGLEQLAAADRPSIEFLHSIVLTEVLYQDPTQAMAGELFERILRAVFPSPPPRRIRESLQATLPEHAAALRATRWEPVVHPRGLSIERILELLLVEEPHGARPDDARIQALEDRLEDRSAAGDSAVRAVLANPQMRARLPRILPASTVARLVKFLAPGRSRELLQAAELIASARALAVPGGRLGATRELVWGALLDLLAEGSSSVDGLAANVIARFRDSASSPAATVFRRHVARLASQAGHVGLRLAMEPSPKNPMVTPPRKPNVSSSTPQDSHETAKPFYVANAGLVLTSPFLQHLFESLNMLQKDEKDRPRWRDRHTASRAVHLLQYLVDGRTSAPEPLLVLNKVLCGLPTATPIERQIEPTAEEGEMCNKLLQAVVANWTAVSNISVTALRETFLQREGKLERDGDKWKLQVQRKTLDVLVDQIPWSFNVVLHSWMSEPVYVTW